LFARRVEKVHTINRKAKRSRNRRTGAYNAPASQKRAIVTLAAGEERIDIFGS
jgi:ribosomal protein L23